MAGWALRYPGFEGVNLDPVANGRLSFTAKGDATPKPPYNFHFPDGNASVARLLWDPDWPQGQSPCELGRKPFGRITIANSDAAAAAYTDQAIDQAFRAVSELIAAKSDPIRTVGSKNGSAACRASKRPRFRLTLSDPRA